MLTVGDPAPWFTARAAERDPFQFSQAAGRYVVLSFFGSAGEPGAAAMLGELRAETRIFDDAFASFFAVSCDAGDEREKRIAQRLPGFHVFWDPEAKIPWAYGLMAAGTQLMRRATFVLDWALRVVAVLPITDFKSHARAVLELLAGLPPVPAETFAPVLVVPRVFEPEFCRKLIDTYLAAGSVDSGFMEMDPATGLTTLSFDHAYKRRRDVNLTDPSLRDQVRARLVRRLAPEIRKTLQFEPTRIERYMVSCYDETGGYFGQHRDNTTKGTAHRRFAVTLNLNAEEYEGGDLRFPEFGLRTYRAPTGGAAVFSCSLLHEALPVTKGTRYAFLPFLYDDAAAKVRDENLKFVAPSH